LQRFKKPIRKKLTKSRKKMITSLKKKSRRSLMNAQRPRIRAYETF
jgi:hypothetical protein